MTGTTQDLLEQLEPVVAENLDRHLSLAQEWHPHDYIPWSQGRDFAFLGGEDYSPEQSQLSETAKAAMFTNLLTEDNLPSYHREIATRFGRDGAWGTWVGRWTAEENRHGIALRDYLVVTRGVDPVELERARMDYMTSGYDSGDKTALEAVTYVSFQELATRVSHRNTGKVTGDPIADRLLARIAKDENLHMVFYRNIVAAALEIAPDETMRAIADEVIGFEMPGATMAGFRRSSMMIAKAGIYDLRLHHDEVIMPILRHWSSSSAPAWAASASRLATSSAPSSAPSTRRPPSSWTAGRRTAPASPPGRTRRRRPTSRPDRPSVAGEVVQHRRRLSAGAGGVGVGRHADGEVVDGETERLGVAHLRALAEVVADGEAAGPDDLRAASARGPGQHRVELVELGLM